MNRAILILLAVPLLASDATDRMLNTNLTSAQRNDACHSLRGDASRDAIEASAKGLHDSKVRACAAENLRRAEEIEPLKAALADEDPEVRAVAARTLGTLERPDLAAMIAKAGEDSQMLVASNAIEGLSYYRDATAVPYLLKLARRSGVIGSLATEQLIRLKAPQALEMARSMVASADPSDLLAVMRVLGTMGDRSDIPSLEGIRKRFPEAVSGAPVRGFGLMPAISLGRAADAAIAQIRSRS